MKRQYPVRLGALLLICCFSPGALLADTLMTSLTTGFQSPAEICAGDAASFPVTITRTNNGNMEIYLTTANLPAGVTATFAPNPVPFTGSTPSATATVTLSTTNNTPLGATPFQIIATDGASHNTLTNTVALAITLCSPGLVKMPGGGICLAFHVTPGQGYQVQATTNLLAPVLWTTLLTTNAVTNLLVFTDMDCTNFPCRFYRLAQP